jgi:hypothetical protein
MDMEQRSPSFEDMQQLAAECVRWYGSAGVDNATGDYFGIREEEREVFKFACAAANMTLRKHRRFRSPKRSEIDDVAFGFLQAWRMGRLAGAEETTGDIESGNDQFYMLRPEAKPSKSHGVESK